jgi:uncharacterized protein involved in exopolysaccharide biosynthesis/Mrp family chromosome partitioning ATPase
MQKEEKGLPHKKTSYTEQIHLSDYLAIIKKRKWLVIIFSLIIIGAVSAISFISTPVYQATTRIIIERMSYPVTKIEESENRDIKEQDFYETQYNLLQSRNLALKVIKDLELWKDLGFDNPIKSRNSTDASRTADTTHTTPDSNNQGTASDPLKHQNTSNNSNWSDMIDLYLGNLKVKPVPGTRLINVSFLSPSPENAARIANAHVNAFINWSNSIKLSSSQQRLTWLNNQVQKQKEKLEASQEKMNDYKRTQGIVAFEDRQNIVSQQMMDLNANLTRVKSERMTKQAAYEQLKSFSIEKENIFALPEVAHDPVILNIRNQFLQLKANKLEMSANYGPKHPKMIDIDSRIKQLEQEIILELQRLRLTIKAELDRALDNERSIQETLNTQKNAAVSINEKAMANDILKQETQSNQQSYDDLLKQAKEVGLSGAMENSNISIVDEAEIPLFPVRPKIFLNILLAIVVSMFMGPFLAFFFQYMDRTIKIPEDVKKRLGMPVFGVVSFYKNAKKNKNAILFWDDSFRRGKTNPHSGIHLIPYPMTITNKSDDKGFSADNNVPNGGKEKHNSTFRDMVNRFIPGFQMVQSELQGKSLFISSTAPGEGKSTVVANSAIGMALNGLKVLMIDTDTERPTFHQLFGLNNKKGFITAMAEIFSNEIQHGTLNDYTMDDLFFLIALKKYKVKLSVQNGSQKMNAYFDNGRLFHIQNDGDFAESRLGTMLVRGGFLTEEQLGAALEWNKRTGHPFGYVLINAGYITRERLQGMLRLQAEENLQKLFSWKQGTFHFEQMDFRLYEDEKIYFDEDYSNFINHLSTMVGSHFIECRLFSNIEYVKEHNVWLLPSGSGAAISHNPAYTMLFTKFFEILKRHFEIILVDAPPVIDIPNAVSLASLCDGVVFVIKAGKLTDKVLIEAMSGLKEAGANILGVVLNQADIKKEYYYYQ